ncbi:MAG: anaerobic glycerol-3-phosphate dehydrogenase subunit GlpB, partial [Anaerolineae bacterium]
RPLDALAALPTEHPYAVLGAARVQAALASFIALTREIGLPYVGGDENMLLPTAVGALRPTLLAPQAQANGDVRGKAPLLIVGFTGLRDFYPELIAENLTKQGFPTRAAFLPLDLLTSQSDRNSIHLAQALDERARRLRLGEALKRLVQPGERIGLPAVLGLDDHIAAMSDLQQAAGAVIFEIPTLPPSAPGMRLFKALRSKLWSLGVRVDSGMRAISANTAPPNGTAGSVQSVETATSSRPLKHRARRYLLATGGILGGGFDSDHTGRVWETVFGLPLTIPQQRYHWFRPQFMDPAGQPVFRGGVAVNAALQPVNAAGQALYTNLWVAGGALAGADPIQERSLEGIALASGMAAAQAMLNQ